MRFAKISFYSAVLTTLFVCASAFAVDNCTPPLTKEKGFRTLGGVLRLLPPFSPKVQLDHWYQEYAADRNDPVVEALRIDPVKTYLKTISKAHAAAAKGEPTYSYFEEGRYTLVKMLKEVEAKLESTLPEALAHLRPKLAELYDRGFKLMEAKIPYHSYQRFTREVTKTLDAFDRLYYPQLTSRYNQGLAEHLFERALNDWKYIVLHTSYQSVDEVYFLRSKPVPFYLLGELGGKNEEISEPAMADGFLLPRSEFWFHDLGHSDYLRMRDMIELLKRFVAAGLIKPGEGGDEEFFLKFKKQIQENIKRMVRKWSKTADRVLDYVNALEHSDPTLFKATSILLFEPLHERGYSYQPLPLQNQLANGVWVDVLLRKRDGGYFRGQDIDPAVFDRLNEAQANLFKFIRQINYDRNLNILSKKKTNTNIRLEYAAEYDKYLGGTPAEMILRGKEDFSVRYKDVDGVHGAVIDVPMIDANLAQIAILKTPTPTDEVMTKIQMLLAAKKRGVPVSVDGKSLQVSHVLVSADGSTVRVYFSGQESPVDLAAVTAPEAMLALTKDELGEQFNSLDIFKVRQLVGQTIRQEKSMFRVIAPIKEIKGEFLGLKETSDGRMVARVRVSEGGRRNQGKELELTLEQISLP